MSFPNRERYKIVIECFDMDAANAVYDALRGKFYGQGHFFTLMDGEMQVSKFMNIGKTQAIGYLKDIIGDMQKNKRWDYFGHLVYEEFARESSPWLTPTMWNTLVVTWLAFGLGDTVLDNTERVFVPCTKFCPKGR